MPKKEEIQQKESPAEEVLKRFRSSPLAEKTSKKRKISGGIFFVNLILLVLLILLYMNKKAPEEYRTSIFKYKGLQFRFSESKDKGSGNYYFSLTIKSMNQKDTRLHFHDRLADIVLYHDDLPVYKMPLGENVTTLTLSPGGTKTLVEMLDRSALIKISDRHPEFASSKRKSWFRPEIKHIPFIAELELNTGDRMSTSLPFDYEVE